MMKYVNDPRAFEVAVIVLFLIVAARWVIAGNWPRAGYWASAAMLNVCLIMAAK